MVGAIFLTDAVFPVAAFFFLGAAFFAAAVFFGAAFVGAALLGAALLGTAFFFFVAVFVAVVVFTALFGAVFFAVALLGADGPGGTADGTSSPDDASTVTVPGPGITIVSSCEGQRTRSIDPMSAVMTPSRSGPFPDARRIR